MSGSKSILVIDDHSKVLAVLVRYLHHGGYHVLNADNGEDGVVMAKTFHPDLIICDMTMPAMSGLDVLQEVRQDKHLLGVPFILMSVKSEEALKEYALYHGADDFLAKPVSPKVLFSKITVLFRKHDRLSSYIDHELRLTLNHFLGILPHELRTPLTAILGASQLISNNLVSMTKDEILEMLDIVIHSSKALNASIERIVILAQLEALSANHDRLEVLRQVITEETSELITETLYSMAQKYFRRSNDIYFEKIEPGSIRVPPVYLDILVREIIDNACKFSEPGSPISVSLKHKGDYFTIIIEDEGRGIPVALRHRLERRFMQVDRNLYEQQGLGLGFSIVRSIVQLFHGKFVVENLSHGGTKVELSFPVIVSPSQMPNNTQHQPVGYNSGHVYHEYKS